MKNRSLNLISVCFILSVLLISVNFQGLPIKVINENGNDRSPSDQNFEVPFDLNPLGDSLGLMWIMGRPALIMYSTPDVIYYNIYRSLQEGPFELIDTVIKTSNPQIYYPPDLPIRPISYYITGLDEKYQESLPSNIVTLALPPIYAPIWENISDNHNGDLVLKWTDNFSSSLEFISEYHIYRINSSEGIPSLIAHIGSRYIHIYVDYGIPNGNWSYFITTIDTYGNERPSSNPYNISVNDSVAPGPPTGLTYTPLNGIANITLSWAPPNTLNNGSDVKRYEIYGSVKPIENIIGYIPNATIIGLGWFPNGTNFYPLTTYTFFNLPDNIYYFIVIAYDDNNHVSSFSNMVICTVDTINPTIFNETITYRTNGNSAKKASEITVKVYDLRGISNVYIVYNIDGGIDLISNMTHWQTFPNGSQIYRGEIPSQSAGSIVNFTIFVFDNYGHYSRSDSFSYTITGTEFSLILISILIGIIITCSIGAIIGFLRLQKKIRMNNKQIIFRTNLLNKLEREAELAFSLGKIFDEPDIIKEF